MQVVGLKVDHREYCLGLQNRRPLLSWRIESDARNIRQEAYRILVASSEEKLHAGQADVWDSGRTESPKSFGIEYSGTSLHSRQRCWWRVEVWDNLGNQARSDIRSWEMGLLEPQDWIAQWLAVEDRLAREDREAGLKWMWSDASTADRHTHRFRLTFELSQACSSGELMAAVKQSYWWSQITRIWLDGDAIGGPGEWIAGPPKAFVAPPGTTACNLTSQRLALKALAPGRHVLAIEIGIRSICASSWFFAMPDTPLNVPGLAALCRLELSDGRILRLKGGSSWKVDSQESATEGWYKTDFDDASWSAASPDTAETYQPWPAQPAMQARRTFIVDKKIARARLYITALGVYEARLNGQSVTDAALMPGPAQYDRQLPYQVFDIEPLVQIGENALGVTVADGWYASFDGRFAFGPPPRRFIAQLELAYDDGGRQVISTGPGWRIAQSPVRSSQIKIGEVHDHSLEQPGWDRTGFDDACWEPAAVAQAPSCSLVAQSIPPIRIKQCIKPRTLTRTPRGDYLIDFGVCFTGWCALRVHGRQGACIELEYGEVLLSGAEIDSSRMGDPTAEARRDVFFLRGDAEGERLSSRFVYRGLRYVLVKGMAHPPDLDGIEGVFIHTDLEETAVVRAEPALIRDIFKMSLQSQKSTFVGVQVDNTSREVRGHICSVGVFCEAAAYLMDVGTFFLNQVSLITREQTSDGHFPIYGPCPPHAKVFPHPPGDEPGTALSVFLIIWQCWRQYGDTEIIAENWPAMLRHVESIRDHNPNYLWLNRRYFDYGDWIGMESTPKDLMATAFWAHAAMLLAQMAEAIGKSGDARRLRELHERIRKAFNTQYVKADGTIGNGSQTSYILPLAFDLLPQTVRTTAAKHLVAAIRGRSPFGLTTGFWGVRYVLDVLADNGHGDLACELLTSTELPSWGYMLQHGATATWEYWDGKNGTHNQPELGAVASFILKRIIGIEPAAPGFTEIDIRPLVAQRSRAGGGEYHSKMGRISTDWTRSVEGQFALDVTIPANTTARIHLPATSSAEIRESRRNAAGREDVRLIERGHREAIVEVGSGVYRFEVKERSKREQRD